MISNIWDVSIPAGRQGTRLYKELSCSLITFGKDPAGNMKSMTTPEMSSYTQQCYPVCTGKYSQSRTKKYDRSQPFHSAWLLGQEAPLARDVS